MSILSRLFGGGKEPEAKEPDETYKGFRIFAAPEADDGAYRVAARIERDVDGEAKVCHLRRADTLRSHDEAVELTLRKARQVIDEQGDGIFR
jgi:hypothetical protein